MESLIHKLPQKNIFIQIGTNDGNDMFRKYVQVFNPNKVILVEPNIDLINKIKENYSFYKGELVILNCAINTKNEDVVLYRSELHGHQSAHFSLVPMNDWGNSINELIKIHSKSITFDYLCSIYNIKHIDLLQIDTEGFDAEIINSIDFESVPIDLLRFEDWQFETDCFTKYSNDKKYIGKFGIDETVQKLLSNNYNCFKINDMDGNDIIATKYS
jgi:FkbM family methyltransferase